MAFNQTQVSEAQRVYLEGIFKEYQNKPDFYRFWTKETEEVPTNYKGRQVAIETKPNPSISFGNLDGGDLASPSNPTLDNFTLTYVWMNVGLEETYGAILNNNKETVGDPLQKAAKSTADQFYQWLNYYVSDGNGTTRLATASASYSGGTPTIFTANGSTDTFGATRIVDGMQFFLYDPTGTTQRTGTVGAGALTVASHTNTAVTSTTNLPSDFVSGDILVPTGGNQIGPKGLPYLVNNSGNYFDVSRSAVPQLQSTVISAGGSLSQTLLQTLYNSMLFKAGYDDDGSTNWMSLCTSPTQLQAYYNLTVTNTQYMHTTQGSPGIDVGGKSVQFTWFGERLRRFLWIDGTRIYMMNMEGAKTAVLKQAGPLTQLPLGDWWNAISGSTSTARAARDRWLDFAGENYLRSPFMSGVLTTLSISGLPTAKSAY